MIKCDLKYYYIISSSVKMYIISEQLLDPVEYTNLGCNGIDFTAYLNVERVIFRSQDFTIRITILNLCIIHIKYCINSQGFFFMTYNRQSGFTDTGTIT